MAEKKKALVVFDTIIFLFLNMSSLDDVERMPVCSCTALNSFSKRHVEIFLNILRKMPVFLSVNSVLYTS